MLKIKEHLDIEEHKISTKFACRIILNTSEYRNSEIDELPTQYSIPPIFDIFYPDKNDSVHIVLPYSEIKINKTTQVIEDKKTIIIIYEQGDTIVDQMYVDKSVNLKTVSRIVNGGVKTIKSPETLLELVHNALPAADLVHYEVIVSQMHRDSNGNLSRLSGKYDEIWGVQKIAKNASWKSALTYQDINRGIKNGLVSGKDAENNVLENIIDNKFDDM